MDGLRHDIRHAFRSLAGQKLVTLAALVTLGLGIGANTAIFSVVYGVLLRPLPYSDPEGLVRISEEHPGANAPVSGLLSDLTLRAWSSSMTTLEAIAAWSDTIFTVGREEPERLRGASVSPELFSILRAVPAAGRFFRQEEAVEGASDVVVLGYGFWQERFAGDANAVGGTLMIGERPHTIIGVAAPGLAFPARETLLWTPYVLPAVQPGEEARGMRVFGALARLAPGVTSEQAAAEGTAAARGSTRPFVANLIFGEGEEVEVGVVRLADEMTAEVRPALRVLAAAVGLVLLIACANVANLLLSRGLTRRRELAVRSALGASRGRIARHLLIESSLMGLAGGAAGWLVAEGMVRLLPRFAPSNFPRLEAVQLDVGALSFAIVAALLTGLGSGLAPALRGARLGPAAALHGGGLRSTSGSGRRLRGALLAAEAALAVVLVVSAGLLVRSFVSMTRVDVGYEASNVLMAQLHLSGSDRREAGRADELIDTLLGRLRARPEVVAAGAANMAPYGFATSVSGFHLPSADPGESPAEVRANSWVVTPGLGDALGLRVTEGRFLSAADRATGTQALLVNEEFSRRYLSDGEPIVGRQYELFGSDEGLTEIVGVVANVLKDGPTRLPQPEIYSVAGGDGSSLDFNVFLFVRTVGDPLPLVPELREMVRQTSTLAAVDRVGSLAGRVSSALAQPRFAATVLGGFAALALVLAATGLYGVMSYSVSQRRREMGVRAALGASRGGIVRLVVGEGLAVVAWGLAIGLAAAAVVTRLMQGLLYGVGPLDPVSFAVAPVVLLIVAALACVPPARRATATDPAIALRPD